VILWAFVLLTFIASAYFSGMETAFTSFDRILTISWLRARKFGARTARFLSEHPERFLNTTLIGNNISNVAYSSLMVLIAERAGLGSVWLLTLSPLLVLVFAEIIPKMTGHALGNLLVRYASYPLLVFYYIFSPLRFLLLPVTRLLMRNGPPVGALLTEPLPMRRDLDQVLVGAEEEGALNAEEGEILERYLDARELKVRQIMTPRMEMVAVSADLSPDAVRDVFRRVRYNVLPVYERDLDHVIGYVHVRDFLVERHSVSEVLRELHAVPESKRIADLLQEFKTEKFHVALVIDEYGGTDGLVTLNDIFEELVGPVAERFDPNEPVIKRLAPGKFLVSGAAFLEDLEDATGWAPPGSEFNTFSGFLTDYLGHIADAGEEVEIDGVIIRVLRRSPRRVESCLLKIPISSSKDNGGNS
jgi:putative hemolysin